MAITGKVADVELEPGSKYGLYFNLNTMAEFDRCGKPSGVRFLKATLAMLVAISKAQTDAAGQWLAAHQDRDPAAEDSQAEIAALSMLPVLSEVDMDHMRLLLHSAVQVYNARGDEVTYPYSVGRIGGLVDLEKWGELLPLMMRGIRNNQPLKTDLPPHVAEAPESDRPTNGIPQPPVMSGGIPSMQSGAEILDFLTENSGG